MRRLLLCILFWLCAAPARGQQPFVRHYWLNESSTPVNVNALAQDTSGYLWLATDAGVYRFNGRSFAPVADSVGQPATAIAAAGGQVWVGYGNGRVGMASSGAIVPLPGGRGGEATVHHLNTGMGGMLWAGTEAGVRLYAGGRSFGLGSAQGLSDEFVYTTQLLPGRRLLAGTDQGINEISFANGKPQIKVIGTAQGLPDNIIRVLQPVPGTTWYWVGTQAGGLALYCYASGRVWVPRISGGWQWGQVNAIWTVSATEAWVATDAGYLLHVLRQGQYDATVTPTHLPDKKINGILADKAGNIWLATNEGLTLTTNRYAAYIPISEPYALKTVTAMACDARNMLWYAQNEQLYRLPLHTAGAKPERMLRAPGIISTLYADAQGTLWVGTLDKGLHYTRDGHTLLPVTGIPNLQGTGILDVNGTANALWVASLNGVEELRYTPGGGVAMLRHHGKKNGVGSDYVYEIYPDSKGRIWLATDGAGVCLYDGKAYTRWDARSGLGSKVVYTLTEDARGHIWAATLDSGLYRYDGTRWAHIPREQGLQDINISALGANATGQVVVVHARGVDEWYPQSGQFRHYNRRLVMHIDSTSPVLQLCARDVAGNVYVPYEHGIMQFRNLPGGHDIGARVHISGISAQLSPVPFGTRSFRHNENQISFHYEGINYVNPDRLRYRYRLHGLSDDWVTTADEEATFPKLRPGTYTFYVQASLNNVFDTRAQASYTFTIARPYWMRWWFLALLVLGGGVLGYAYIRLRERNLRKLGLLQKERMLFEYEHLKSQVNPHFLFNSLNTLTSLIEEDTHAAVTYTTQLADLYRHTLTFRDKDLIPLYEEWNILTNYMYIQKTRFGDALVLDAQVPQEYMRSKRIVPLALQLLVENAIKHNVVSRAHPLTIHISTTEDSITVRNDIRPKITKEKGAGLGLSNIRKRYGLLTRLPTQVKTENNQYIVTLPLL